MARTHARKKGKSGSKRPVVADLSFVKIKSKEVESLIAKMAKEQDMTASMIGLVLRDRYGVPSVKKLTGKSIVQILGENKLTKKIPEDLAALVARQKQVKKHLEKNKNDLHNKRGLILLEARLNRLSKYYKNVGRIESNWSYE